MRWSADYVADVMRRLLGDDDGAESWDTDINRDMKVMAERLGLRDFTTPRKANHAAS
jgi:hypothetical protein